MITEAIVERVNAYADDLDSGERTIAVISNLYPTNAALWLDFSHDEFDDYAKIYDIIRQTDCK